MQAFAHTFVLALPLFLMVAFGWGAVKLFRLPPRVSKVVSTVVFNAAVPALLFHVMAQIRSLPVPDARVLVAFFGGCLVVFALGWFVSRWLPMERSGRPVFAIGGVFSNNVMLGLPLARLMLGPEAVPTVALVLVFNALILWTLVTVSMEWVSHGGGSWKALGTTLLGVMLNPIIIAVLLGLAWSVTGWTLPQPVEVPLKWVGEAAGPLALLALGMGLAEFGIGKDRRVTMAVVGMKLFVHPLAVWLLALAIGLPSLQTKVLVLLASIAIGSNVYLMARRFGALEGPVAQGLLVSTVLSSVTMPVLLALVS